MQTKLKRAVFALIIINKAGGLIYNRTFQEGGLKKLSTNDYLVLAGTFHGLVKFIIFINISLIYLVFT